MAARGSELSLALGQSRYSACGALAEATGYPAASVSPAAGKPTRRLLLYLRQPGTRRPRPHCVGGMRIGIQRRMPTWPPERWGGLPCSTEVKEEPTGGLSGGGGHAVEQGSPARRSCDGRRTTADRHDHQRQLRARSCRRLPDDPMHTRSDHSDRGPVAGGPACLRAGAAAAAAAAVAGAAPRPPSAPAPWRRAAPTAWSPGPVAARPPR